MGGPGGSECLHGAVEVGMVADGGTRKLVRRSVAVGVALRLGRGTLRGGQLFLCLPTH